jgi:adenylosuccinate synthase
VDRGDDYDALGVTIAYVYHNPAGVELSSNGRVYKNGAIIHAGDPYPSEAVLYHCYPIVKKIPGWRDTPIAATKRAPGTPLPAGVCAFISTIEHFTKATVLSIGNGPIGANIIYLKRQ